MDSSADFKWSLLGARRAHQHRQAEPRRDPNRGTRPGGGRVCRARRPAITVGSFVATSGQKPWPSAGSFVAAYGQFFMDADIVRAALHTAGVSVSRPGWVAGQAPAPISKEQLQRLYVDQDLSARQVAEELKCGQARVLAALRRHGIPVHAERRRTVHRCSWTAPR